MMAKEVRGFLEDKSGRRPFVLRVSDPQKSDAGDYFCEIALPAVAAIGPKLKIFGVDAAQASNLALKFVRHMLSPMKVFDEKGRPMKI